MNVIGQPLDTTVSKMGITLQICNMQYMYYMCYMYYVQYVYYVWYVHYVQKMPLIVFWLVEAPHHSQSDEIRLPCCQFIIYAWPGLNI